MASDADPAALMFQTLYKFYQESNNCDFKLVSGDNQKFHLHSFVLCAAIPKLRKTIIENSKKNVRKLRVKEIQGREMELLIQFAYLGKCDLQQEDKGAVVDLIKAAEYLQMTELEEELLQLFKNNLNMDSALKVISNKGNGLLKRALPMAEHHVFRHLLKEGAPNLSADEFKALLANEKLHALHEEGVWEAILRWISVDSEKRSPSLISLLSTLRVGLMAVDSIGKISSHPLIAENPQALAFLRKAVNVTSSYQMPSPLLLKEPLPLEVRPRIPHISILAIGGWRTGEHLCCMAEAYDTIADKWISVPTLRPDHPRGYHGLETIGKSLFMIGGGDNEKSLSTCCKLDLATHTWSPISSMHHARCFVSTATLAGELYAIGGRELEHRLKHAERYSPETDKWTRLPNTNFQHSDAAAAALDGKVYVVGGFNGNEVLSALECYSPDTNTWTTLTPMNKPRSGLTCVAHRGQLFVFGGFDGTLRLSDGERYNPNTRTWTTLASMKMPRSTFQLVRVEDTLFAMGGYSDHPEATVEAYDVIGDKWYTLRDMLAPTSALACVVVDDLSFSQSLWSSASRADPSCSLRDLLREYPPFHPFDSQLQLPEGAVEVHHPQFADPLPVPWADLFVTNDEFDMSEDDDDADFIEADYVAELGHHMFYESDVSELDD